MEQTLYMAIYELKNKKKEIWKSSKALNACLLFMYEY